MNTHKTFYQSIPRAEVDIHLPDGKVISGPRGASVGQFLEVVDKNNLAPIVGAIINNELRELTYPIKLDSNVQPVTMGDADGMRIYRRSLTFLLETVFSRLYPNAELTIDHSVSSGGYYCQVSDREPLGANELIHVEQSMRTLVEEDIPFTRKEIPLPEAILYFEKQGATDKVRLLKHRQKAYLTVYEFNGHLDYHHGYMVPSTGYLKWFTLALTDHGFTLRFPRRHAPTQISPLPEYPKLLSTFRQYGDWLERLGISSVGSLNDAISRSSSRELILVSEALHEQYVSEIASTIASQVSRLKIILIAGPSSSGKTTFSKRLTIQLLARGIVPFPMEMDNYFVDRELTPKDEHGEYDFESLDALNRAQLSIDLRTLISGNEVHFPKYDFINGKSVPGEVVQLSKSGIIILEGLHGLNPKLLTEIPEEQIFRIYISALTQLNLDRHNRVSTTDTRLIRRIVRDAREKGLYSSRHYSSLGISQTRGKKIHLPLSREHKYDV